MAKTEGTYIQVHIKMFLAISQPILDCFLQFKDWKLVNMCVNKVQHMMGQKTSCNQSRPVFFAVFWFFDKRLNWQLKNFRNCATATGGLVFCSWVQFDFSLFFGPVNWTCKHYTWVRVQWVRVEVATLNPQQNPDPHHRIGVTHLIPWRVQSQNSHLWKIQMRKKMGVLPWLGLVIIHVLIK